jgi:hypothetical protein
MCMLAEIVPLRHDAVLQQFWGSCSSQSLLVGDVCGVDLWFACVHSLDEIGVLDRSSGDTALVRQGLTA